MCQGSSIQFQSFIISKCMLCHLNTTVQQEKDCENPRCIVSSQLNTGIRCVAYIYQDDDYLNPVCIVNIEYSEKINPSEAVVISDEDVAF